MSSNKRPNILMIITHDTGRYLGCYGAPVQTPHLDRLATEGVKFDHEFCTAPQCSPSRGSILTGKVPHANGLMGLVNEGWDLPEENVTLPKVFNEFGYSTHLIGLQHEHSDPTTLGYRNISTRRDFPYFARQVTRRAKEFLDGVRNGAIRQPFYCSVGFMETHRPFVVGDDDEPTPADQVQLPPYLPDDHGLREEIGEFEGSVREADACVGEILAKLDEVGLTENTLVIYTVDHGWAFPRAKCTLLDEGTGTALIMRWPGRIEGGWTSDALLSNLDLFPTLCEIAGQPVPEGVEVQGRSFKSLLEGGSYEAREWVPLEMTYHDSGYNPIRGIRTTKWKYIRNFAPFPVEFEIPNDIRDAPAGKAYIAAHPEYMQARVDEELYDLEKDPWEMHNLADVVEHQQVKSELRRTLEQFLLDTNDPVAKGGKPVPHRAKSSGWYERG